MLPFQTAPLAAPLRSRAIIVPITLAYQSVEGKPVSAANRDLIYCYDDMPEAPHFWKLLALRRIEARVTIRPKIDCSRYEDNSAGRKKLAEDCYNRVLGRVYGSCHKDSCTISCIYRSIRHIHTDPVVLAGSLSFQGEMSDQLLHLTGSLRRHRSVLCHDSSLRLHSYLGTRQG